MSKERLEEAIRAIKSNWPDERYSLLRDALDYVISEAKRVQELEEKHKEYVSFTESNNYNMDVEFEKLYKQNKRYREAIEKVLYETGDKVIQDILEIALESDEG